MKTLTKTELQHLLKVQTYLEAGVDKIRLFEEDEHQFKAWQESGFLDYLFDSYEHEVKLGGELFIFDLLKPKK